MGAKTTSKLNESRYQWSDEAVQEGKDQQTLFVLRLKAEEGTDPQYLRELAKETLGGQHVYCDVAGHWREIENLTVDRHNRVALGSHFKALRRLYSEKNIGGNRRTSGHGTFEKECQQRGYPPRTVRGWIADYDAILSGAPTEAQKRTARTKAKTKSNVRAEYAKPKAEAESVTYCEPDRIKDKSIEARRRIYFQQFGIWLEAISYPAWREMIVEHPPTDSEKKQILKFSAIAIKNIECLIEQLNAGSAIPPVIEESKPTVN